MHKCQLAPLLPAPASGLSWLAYNFRGEQTRQNRLWRAKWFFSLHYSFQPAGRCVPGGEAFRGKDPCQ